MLHKSNTHVYVNPDIVEIDKNKGKHQKELF